VEERKEEEKLKKENAVEKIKVENLAEKDAQKEENLAVEKEDAHENVLENARGENVARVLLQYHLDLVWGVKIEELNAEKENKAAVVIHSMVAIYLLHLVIHPLTHLLCHGLPVLEAFPAK
jgi:hypothetical protein